MPTPYLLTLVLVIAAGAAHARTVVECLEADGSTTFRNTCPPGTTQKGQKKLGGVGPTSDPAIGAAAAAYPITVYTIPDCDACDLLRHSLSSRGIPFREIDVQDNAERQQQLLDRSGGLTVPTVLVGDKTVSGYSRDALDAALLQAGYPLDGSGPPAPPPAAAAPAPTTPPAAARDAVAAE